MKFHTFSVDQIYMINISDIDVTSVKLDAKNTVTSNLVEVNRHFGNFIPKFQTKSQHSIHLFTL